TVNVRMRDSSNLHLAEGGQDVGSDLLPVDPLGRWPLAREIVPLESRADVGNGGGCSVLLLLANGISAAVDGALESFGFLACRSGAPIGERPNGVAAFAPVELAAVVQDERTTACGSNAAAEAFRRVVIVDFVAALGRWQLP